MVSKGLVCLYILEKVEIWAGVTDASQTSEYRATQLLSSIKHKLSHAISPSTTPHSDPALGACHSRSGKGRRLSDVWPKYMCFIIRIVLSEGFIIFSITSFDKKPLNQKG